MACARLARGAADAAGEGGAKSLVPVLGAAEDDRRRRAGVTRAAA
jgi:hypothetical protein